MNEKNINNKRKAVKVSADDIQLYRLFYIFGAAILGFAAFRLIPYATFSRVLLYCQWVALGLLVFSIGALVYIHLVKKLDESGKIVTTTGIAYFLLPVLFLLSTFRVMEQPIFKCQVAFGFIALFAAIYNIFKNEFRAISAVTFLSIVALYYACTPLYTWFEMTLNVISKGLIFILPAALIVMALLAKNSKKENKLITDKSGAIITIIMCVMLLVCAVVALIVPSAFLYIMFAIFALYIVLGIVCTIRLI
jgi:hypothetical protein